MNLTKSLSNKITDFVGDYCNLSTEELEKVKYGIELFLMNIYKTIVILLAAQLLSILPHTILFMLSYSLVRSFAFGIHANNGITCLICTSLVFLGSAYISPYVYINTICISLIFIFNAISAILYAPADTQKRPLINPLKRKLLKIKTLVSLLILYLIAIFYCNSTCANIVTFACSTACIVINPLVYKISGQQYNNYRFYKKEA